MSPRSFSRLFPFHIIFDENLVIQQCGESMARLIPQLANSSSSSPAHHPTSLHNETPKCKLTDIFTIIRPHISLDYQSIRSQIMSVFVMCSRTSSTVNPSPSRLNSAANLLAVAKQSEESLTRFKGQMVYLEDRELIMFLCSPSVMSLDDLAK